MLQVLGSIIVFPAVIGLLTVVLLAAEARLRPQRKIKITINGDEAGAIETDAGGTLLNTLSSNGVMLPSACGGGGTCGVCRCQVLDGGGDILPTEQQHINFRDAKESWRLSCQVKVRDDMQVQVPDEVFSINKWQCEVISNDSVATFIREFVLRMPEGEELNHRSGGYIQIEVPPYEIDFGKDIDVEDEYRGDWEQMNLFTLGAKNTAPIQRAYSMANHPAEGNIVMLNVRIATPPRGMEVQPGLASSYVYARKPGDVVTISGPYGEFFIQETEREMVYIGGGAGMAPLRAHIFHLFHTLNTGRKVSYWYGAPLQARDLLRGSLPRHRGEVPEFLLPHRAVGAAAGRQLGWPGRLHPPGGARRVPRQAGSAGGHRVLPVRAAADADRGTEDAVRPRRGTRDDPLRRVLRVRRNATDSWHGPVGPEPVAARDGFGALIWLLFPAPSASRRPPVAGAKPCSGIYESIAGDLRLVEAGLLRQIRALAENHEKLVDRHAYLKEVIASLTAMRGKLLRPALVLFSGRAVQGPDGGSAQPDSALNAMAVAAELVHAASLIHDDIIDHALMRRAHARCTASWHQHRRAVGDVLYAQVLYPARRVAASGRSAPAAGAVVLRGYQDHEPG